MHGLQTTSVHLPSHVEHFYLRFSHSSIFTPYGKTVCREFEVGIARGYDITALPLSRQW